MTCAACRRAGRGYGYQPPTPPLGSPPPKLDACSMRCLDTLYRSKGKVFDLHHYEKQALDAASDAAGEYLEEIGRTDLATLTGEEWRNLLEIVFVRSTATIQRLSEEGAVPF